MNLMRSKLGGGGGEAEASSQPDRQLTLSHLRKLFQEVARMSMTSPEYERKLARMFPLFNKVMGMYSPDELGTAMKELPAFTAHLVKLFVAEVKKRASNQSTEAAGLAIMALVEPRESGASPPASPEEPPSESGWFLLSALEFLTRSPEAVDASVKAALPSTLAKAVYLFYDLPPPADAAAHARRDLVRDLFLSILSRLCSQPVGAEELARKEDLGLLFSGASSWVPPHNAAWRKLTAQLLITLSSRSLSPPVLHHVHSKNCVGQFVENLRRGGSEDGISVGERAEMIVVLFCLLKDSAPLTPLLLDDLRDCGGYEFLQSFILENESSPEAESVDAIRNLVLMLSSVVTAGHTEVKVTIPGGSLSLPGFSVPLPLGLGCSVRNLAAFSVLEKVFLKSENPGVCHTVLDVVNSIYSSDPANFFILQPLATLPTLAGLIHTKEKPVQIKYFELVEYVVFHLNHIPVKEFAAFAELLKSCPSMGCRILCVQSLFRLLSAGAVLKDAYRESGLLETLLGLLQRNAGRAKAEGGLGSFAAEERTLALLLIDILTLTLKANAANAGQFRELGGGKSCRALLSGAGAVAEWRGGLLQLFQQLLMLPGGDEDLQSLLGLLHSEPKDGVSLKMAILKALLCVLRESHRVRLAFRRVGGFLYLMSLLLSLEGALGDVAWAEALPTLRLLQLLFRLLSISMRFEPANARAFQAEVRYQSLSESLRLLGCFGGRGRLSPRPESAETRLESLKDPVAAAHRVFEASLDDDDAPDDIPTSLAAVAAILRLLYNMALDNYEKVTANSRLGQRGESPHLLNREGGKAAIFPAPPDSIIVHPGAVCVILDLLPSIAHPEAKWELAGQLYAGEILKSLVRSERNQQVMCEAGLPRQLFGKASALLRAESDSLLPTLYYILERLSAQGMQPRELREFLRLDSPLCCRGLEDVWGVEDEDESSGGPVPLSRVKALVSMMTPRDFRAAGQNGCPAFVELDMSVEGFGCVFLPSIAPLIPNSGSSADAGRVSGGVGSGERPFPPLTGLSFLTWLYVERSSEPKVDSHPIRLLTLSRAMPNKTAPNRRHSELASGGDRLETLELACLSIQISPLDSALLISTAETDTPGADLDRDSGPPDCFARIPLASLREERQWIQLAVVLTRSVLKASTATVYVNGEIAATSRLNYISPTPGSPGAQLPQPTAVHATIGTPPGPLRKQSRLLWRLGTTHFVEDTMGADAVATAFSLGPSYTGSFQRPCLLWSGGERSGALVSEDRLCWGLAAQASSTLTLAKLRKLYSRNDTKAVARYLGLATTENSTPVRVLHNAAGHLGGPARSLGGVLIGYLGMRSFVPSPVGRLVESVGGVGAVLGLVAMAADTQGLYAALKALLCALRHNPTLRRQMDAIRGYQVFVKTGYPREIDRVERRHTTEGARRRDLGE